MTRQSKIQIMIVALGLVLLVTLFYPKPRDISIDLPPPERLAEPLQTHYLGAAALDLPSSFQLDALKTAIGLPPSSTWGQPDDLKAIFHQIDPSDPTATITVVEKTGGGLFSAYEDCGTMSLGRQLETVDLSDKFGRPAALRACYKDFPKSWDIPQKLSGGSENMADPVKLEIVLKVKEQWGFLEFRYLRWLERAEAEHTGGWWRIGQTALVEWAEKISDSYQWRDGNKSPMGPGLAMRFGQLVPPSEGQEWKANFEASFYSSEPPQGSSLNLYGLHIQIEGFNDRPTVTTTTNRTVGGYPGIEKRAWQARPRNNFQWLFNRAKMFALNLSWDDGSGREPNIWKPSWRINLSSLSTIPDVQKTARSLWVWETALDSLRLSSSVSDTDVTDGQPLPFEMETAEP